MARNGFYVVGETASENLGNGAFASVPFLIGRQTCKRNGNNHTHTRNHNRKMHYAQ